MASAPEETFGFKAEAWENAKREAICAMLHAAKRSAQTGKLLFYSELAKQITSITIEPHSYAMDLLLDQISKEEDAAGRGILTAVVVLKEEGIPAAGFWVSAAEIGRDVRDRIAFWSNEASSVLENFDKHPLFRLCKAE